MTPIKFIAALFAVVFLAGCQANSGSSSYNGGINDRSTKSTTVRKKVGKRKVVGRDGEIYYVNKYVTVKRKSSTRRKTRTAYVAKRKRRATKSTRAIKRATKRSAKRSTKRTKRKVVAKASKRSTKRSKSGGPSKNIDALIRKHAKANGVPVNLARAVVKIESSYRVNARGAAGEVGLMQLMPRTARGIGYKGKMKNLYNPDTNLAYGMKYLGKAYKLGGRTPCGAILKYNAGHGAKRWNPISRKYCNRVKKILKKG